jgi:hypothetical protein
MLSDETAAFLTATPVILFSDTEVLLDNQAGRSVFRNSLLDTNVSAMSRLVCIGGVDGSSKGIVVRVSLCSQAAENILSKAEMVDAGHHITYVNDEYHLDRQGVTMFLVIWVLTTLCFLSPYKTTCADTLRVKYAKLSMLVSSCPG